MTSNKVKQYLKRGIIMFAISFLVYIFLQEQLYKAIMRSLFAGCLIIIFEIIIDKKRKNIS